MEGAKIQRSKSSLRSHKIRAEHIWTIEDYKSNVQSMGERHSDEFTVVRNAPCGKEKIKFHMLMYPKKKMENDGDNTYLSAYLKLLAIESPDENCKKQIKVSFIFCVLDDEGEHRRKRLLLTISFSVTKLGGCQSVFAWKIYLQRKVSYWLVAHSGFVVTWRYPVSTHKCQSNQC